MSTAAKGLGTRASELGAALLKDYFGGPGGVVLFAYAMCVGCLEAFRISDGISSNWWCLGACLLVLALHPLAVRLIRWIGSGAQNDGLASRLTDRAWKRAACFATFFAVTFGVLYLWRLAWYPMALSADILGQYAQALTGQYNDWHPVAHTLFAYTLPLKVTGNPASILLFQIIGYSLMLAWMLLTVLEYGGVGWALALHLFVLLSPMTGSMMVHPLKDVWFATMCGLVATSAIWTLFTRGKWLSLWRHVALVVLASTCCVLFRHNGVLFVVPALLAMLVYVGRQQRVAIIVGVVGLLVAVKFCIYPLIGVTAPDRRSVEILGLPMTAIGEVVKECPAELDQQTKEFAYSVAPPDMWERFKIGNFNSIKWESATDQYVIRDAGVSNVLRCMLRCVQINPVAAFKSIAVLTSAVWSPGVTGVIEPELPEDAFGVAELTPKSSMGLRLALTTYSEYAREGVLRYLSSIGSCLFALVALCALKIDFKKKLGKATLVLSLAPMLYCFGTMLLLTGPDHRFFFAMPMAMFACAFCVLKQGPADDLPK